MSSCSMRVVVRSSPAEHPDAVILPSLQTNIALEEKDRVYKVHKTT